MKHFNENIISITLQFRNIFLGFLIVTFISCENSSDIKIYHPTQENLHPDIGISIVEISRNSGNTVEVPDEMELLSSRINNAQLELTIGKKSGADYEMLGNINAAVIDNDSKNLFVLDYQQLALNMFDPDGDFIKQVSRGGRGPGELIHPKLILIADQKLYLLNKHFNILVYDYDKETQELEFMEEIHLEHRPDDICHNGEVLFVNTIPVAGPTDSVSEVSNISAYVIDNLNEPEYEFGKMYQSDSWFSKMHMSMGGIVCAENSKTVVQFYRNLNLIYGFDELGNIAWISRIIDFEILELIEERGRIGPDSENLPENFDSIENLVSINEDYFLLQTINRSFSDEDASSDKIHTYLIDYNTGTGMYVTDDLPMILSATTDYLLIFDDSNIPQIKKLRI